MASWQSVSGCESGCFDYYAAAEALVTEMAVYFSEKGWVAKRPTWSFILLLRNTFCYFCRNNIFLVLYWYLLFFLSLFNTCILIIKTRKNIQHNLVKSVTQHDCHLPRSQYHNCGLGCKSSTHQDGGLLRLNFVSPVRHGRACIAPSIVDPVRDKRVSHFEAILLTGPQNGHICLNHNDSTPKSRRMRDAFWA